MLSVANVLRMGQTRARAGGTKTAHSPENSRTRTLATRQKCENESKPGRRIGERPGQLNEICRNNTRLTWRTAQVPDSWGKQEAGYELARKWLCAQFGGILKVLVFLLLP